MSIAQSIQLIDKLVKARIPKPTATELVDQIDNNKPDILELENDIKWIKNDIKWLRWAVTSLVALMFGIIGIITYLHNNMQQDIRAINSKIDSLLIQKKF